MTETTIVPVTSLVQNIVYCDLSNPDFPEHFKWRRIGDTRNMTFGQLRRMFELHPNYKDWLCPAPDALEPLGMTQEHYTALEKKYKALRRLYA